MYRNEAHKKDAMTNLASIYYVIIYWTLVLSDFRLANETCTIALMYAGTQANQLTSMIDHAGNITNFTKNCGSKSFFFSQDSMKNL